MQNAAGFLSVSRVPCYGTWAVVAQLQMQCQIQKARTNLQTGLSVFFHIRDKRVSQCACVCLMVFIHPTQTIPYKKQIEIFYPLSLTSTVPMPHTPKQRYCRGLRTKTSIPSYADFPSDSFATNQVSSARTVWRPLLLRWGLPQAHTFCQISLILESVGSSMTHVCEGSSYADLHVTHVIGVGLGTAPVSLLRVVPFCLTRFLVGHLQSESTVTGFERGIRRPPVAARHPYRDAHQ